MEGNERTDPNPTTAGVVVLVQPAELRQARYYKVVLAERRAQLRDEISEYQSALANRQAGRREWATRRLRQMIRDKRKEEFQLDCLLDALQHRFFPKASMPVQSIRSFDVAVAYEDGIWRVQIPELDVTTTVRRRADAEMTAREHIAISIGAPIREIAVRLTVDA